MSSLDWLSNLSYLSYNKVMNIQEKRLYHQIHPVKLATDIGVTFPFLYFFWLHQVWLAFAIGFIPPIIVSTVMMVLPPNLEKRKKSALGKYIKRYMTPVIETIRLLTLAPMAYGSWTHDVFPIVIGVVLLVVAWCNGLIMRSFRT